MFIRLLAGAVISALILPTAQAQSVGADQRAELEARLSAYGQCQAACATDLATLILDKGVEDALAIAGLAKSGKSKALSGVTGKLAFYAVLRKVWASGKEVVDSYNVCTNRCDAMYDDVVELGRAGLLGPIIKDKPIPKDWFEDARVRKIWDQYIKPLDPKDLPWQFHNEKRWAEIMNTA